MTTSPAAIQITNLHYKYGDRVAVDGISQTIAAEQIYVILGPNGSGKSTLFKLMSTLIPLQQGEIELAGFSVRNSPNAVRQRLGVVFQYPSLDRKLSVKENIECQASLVGLRGADRKTRVTEVLELLKLADRTKDRVEKLSGGLKRRVELAKGILHRPQVLLLDEPSTGLDPAARLDYWAALQELKNNYGTTVVMTTHLLEEAEKADEIAIFNRGKLVANDAPEALRQQMGQSILTLQSRQPAVTQKTLQERFGWTSEIVGHQVRVRDEQAAGQAGEVARFLGDGIDSLTIARPSLEDVFVAKTGESYQGASEVQATKK